MAIPADLKFDVRVRERLLSRGLVTEAEVEKHLSDLPDLESEAADLTAKQPALQKESDRDIVIVRTSGVRPPIAPVVHDDSDLPLDDDIDDDDDLDVKAKKPEKAVVKPVEAAAVEVDDEDDEDDEDEDEDDDDDDDDEEKVVDEEKPDGEEQPAGEEKPEAPKDDDWGAS
jgi:hypothetical protein